MKTKKWGRAASWAVLLAPFLCAAGFAVLAFMLYRHLSHAAVTVRDIQTLLYLAMGCIGVSAAAIVLGIVVLFLRGAKKGKTIVGMLLSVLVILFSAGILWGYEYIMSALSVDRGFQGLDNNELGIVDSQDGIDRDHREETIDLSEYFEQNQMQEISRYLTLPGDIPEDIREAMHQGDPTGKSYLLPGAEKVETFLLYGLDIGESSDLIMMVTIDRVHQKIKLNSIARDSFVRMPQWGSYAKLAYAYTWGGPQLAVKTLNSNLSMNISNYIALDFTYMEKIVDYFGGVDIELDEKEAAYLRKNGFTDVRSGMYHLDGERALAYARMRHSGVADNDTVRTGRQRKVVMAMIAKLKQASVAKYPGFVRDCMSMCTTSFEAQEILSLCLEVVQGDYVIEQHMIPLDAPQFIWREFGVYGYYFYDLNRASDCLYRWIYEELYVSGYED